MMGLDLQISDTWTRPEYRGRGLATLAIEKIVASHHQQGGMLWYVVEEHNAPSIRAVEKTGFKKVGWGLRRKRLGLRVLGAYQIENKCRNQDAPNVDV